MDKLLSTVDVAERLDVGVSTVKLWCKRGTLKCYKVGNSWVIPESALEGFKKPKRGRPPRDEGEQ